MTKTRLVLVLHLIGRERGASILDQSERSKAKPMQSLITFDTQLKIALITKLKFVCLPRTEHLVQQRYRTYVQQTSQSAGP